MTVEARAATALCAWCGKVPVNPDHGQETCGRKCRQARYRTRKRYGTTHGPGSAPGLFAYADPPYVGLSSKYYKSQPSYAGEVDHELLIERLTARWVGGELIGWALSCSAASLRQLLPLCPEVAFPAAWGKLPNVAPAETHGKHNRWEALIVVGGRKLKPGASDFLAATPARLGGETLPGRKPIAFCVWLFQLLGMRPGDTLEDMYPGTGNVTRAWRAAGGVVQTRLSEPPLTAGDERQLELLASG